jgi:hypothetical protein
VNVECFGDGYMVHFKAAGHNLQPLVKLGKDADSSTRDQALRSSIRRTFMVEQRASGVIRGRSRTREVSGLV